MKKMLRFVGIAALAAVIGFGFASCEGPAGLTGGTGPGGGQGEEGIQGPPGSILSPAANLSLGGAGTVDPSLGLYRIDLGNVAHAELGDDGFYHIITLSNTGLVTKSFDALGLDLDHFDVDWAHDDVQGPVVVLSLLANPALAGFDLLPGETVRIRLLPRPEHFANNSRGTEEIAITGSYMGRRFSRTVAITLTAGVYAEELERLIEYAEARFAPVVETPLTPEDLALLPRGTLHATEAEKEAFQGAIDYAAEELYDVMEEFGNAATRQDAIAGQSAVSALYSGLNAAIYSFFEHVVSIVPFPNVPGDWAIYSAPEPRMGATITVTPPTTDGVPAIASLTFQWQRQAGGTGSWHYIPGANALSLQLRSPVTTGDNVRLAIGGHADYQNIATDYVEVLEPLAAVEPSVALAGGNAVEVDPADATDGHEDVTLTVSAENLESVTEITAAMFGDLPTGVTIVSGLPITVTDGDATGSVVFRFAHNRAVGAAVITLTVATGIYDTHTVTVSHL